MGKRKVSPGDVQHVCQMTVGKVVLFYTVADYLVFFTMFCTWAEKMGIQVLALCPMPDHIHHACIAPNEMVLTEFERSYTQLFSRLWNKQRKRKGPLFYHSYKRACKQENKSIRTTLAYNYNNPVERHLTEKAEDYRWNFLAYATNAWPFSEPVDPPSASTAMRRGMSEVRHCHEQGKHLSYAQIHRIMDKLNRKERQQLIDYIIGLWNIIDYSKAISYYGNIDAMIRAFHDNTGSEYEIREDRDPYSDTVYSDCTRILLKERLIDSVYDIPSLPMAAKSQLYALLRTRTAAKPKQLRKYLHIPGNEVVDFA